MSRTINGVTYNYQLITTTSATITSVSNYPSNFVIAEGFNVGGGGSGYMVYFTKIGDNLFYTSDGVPSNGLVSVTIPYRVTHIGENAFRGGLINGSSTNSVLTSVIFEENSQLTSIGDAAFLLAAIPRINIPASVTSIGGYCFYNTPNLSSVIFERVDWGQINIGTWAFNTTSLANATIYISTSIAHNLLTNGQNAPFTSPSSGTVSFFGATVYLAPTFKPENKSDLQTAVNNWCNGSPSTPPISLWDTSLITDMSNLFYGQANFNDDISGWDTSIVENMYQMFYNAPVFNQNIGVWNTYNVTNMSGMFANASAFNNSGSASILQWNTTAVTDMSTMFNGAIAFNQYIGGWQTQNVTNMSNMFANANAFDQNIGSWTTTAVTNMAQMFQSAIAFNQDIGGWQTQNVTDMSAMFYNAGAFNNGGSASIGNWNTSKVTNMVYMFKDATVFNQNIRYWNIGSSVNLGQMFSGATAFIDKFYYYHPLAVRSFPINLAEWEFPAFTSSTDNATVNTRDYYILTDKRFGLATQCHPSSGFQPYARYYQLSSTTSSTGHTRTFDGESYTQIDDGVYTWPNDISFVIEPYVKYVISFGGIGSSIGSTSLWMSLSTYANSDVFYPVRNIGYGSGNETPSDFFFNTFIDNDVTYYFTEDSNNAVTITSAMEGMSTVNGNGRELSNYNLTIPSSFTVAGVVHTIRHIGDTAFGTQSSDTLMNLSSVTIPSTVLTIGNSAFRLISSLTTVTFVGTSECTSFGNGAFQATGLYVFTLPASVTDMGTGTWFGVSSLTNFTFEENSQCTSIGESVFAFTTGLETIIIPPSITTITGGTWSSFVGSKLKIVYVLQSTLNNIDALFQSPSHRASFYGSNFTTSGGTQQVLLLPPRIPFAVNGITYSYEDIYGNDGITNNAKISGIVSGSPTGDFVVPGGSSYISAPRWNGSAFISTPITITELGGQICKNNTNITSVTIPTSITVIHPEAFYACTGLTSVIFDQGSAVSQCQVIGEDAFNGCSALTSINLPYSINAISTNVFQNTVLLQTVYMSAATATALGVTGSSVTVPSTNVSFRGATSVNLALSLIIGTGVGSTFTKQNWFDAGSPLDVEIRDYETIFNNAFTIALGSSDTIYSNIVTNVVFGSGVTTLRPGTPFWYTSDLISITLGPDIANITRGFVGKSPNLTTLLLDANNTVLHLDNGILYKKDGSNNTHTMIQYPLGRPAEALTIPSSTVVISDMFAYNSNISSIVFGNNSSVQTIGIESFSESANLTSIDIPDSVTSIGLSAFRDSGTNLTDISLPEGATIATRAFKNLGNGTNDVTVKVRGLYTSNALTAWETTNQSQFSVTGSGTLSFMLDPAVFTYTIITGTNVSITGSNYGTNLSGILTIPSTIVDGTTYTVTKISANAFENTSITSVFIHKDITEIGSDAFLGCSNLTTVILPTDNGFSPQLASPSNAQVSFYGATVMLLSSMSYPTNITFPSGNTNNNQVTVNELNSISAAKLLYSTNGGLSFTEVTLNGLDSYTFTIPDGTYNTNGNMKIIAVDAIGNESITVSNTTNFTIDTSAPIISHQSSVVATINDGGTNLGSVSVSAADQPVTWSISAGTGVNISNDTEMTVSLPHGATSTVTIQGGLLTLPSPADHQTRQSYTFTVKAVDSFGNESTVTKTVIVIDTTPPNPPGVVFPTGTGGLTNDGTTTVSLSATSVAWEYTVDNGITWTRYPAIGS